MVLVRTEWVWGSCMAGTPPLCWPGHLIYTYSSPLPKQDRYDHPHFPGKKPEVQSLVCPSLPQCLIGKTPWRRKWQPTPVYLPGKSHEHMSLGQGYGPWGCRVGHD